jgi:hypothetical protein
MSFIQKDARQIAVDFKRPEKGSVLTADKTVAIARSVRLKAGSVKINLADGSWGKG